MTFSQGWQKPGNHWVDNTSLPNLKVEGNHDIVDLLWQRSSSILRDKPCYPSRSPRSSHQPLSPPYPWPCQPLPLPSPQAEVAQDDQKFRFPCCDSQLPQHQPIAHKLAPGSFRQVLSWTSCVLGFLSCLHQRPFLLEFLGLTALWLDQVCR